MQSSAIDFAVLSREDTFVAEKVNCETHGEAEQAFTCTHLIGENAGLGFNRDEPSGEDPFPDSWCDNCEIIRAQHGGWNDVPDELCKIVLLCAECYERTRIRNTKPAVTLDDLAGIRWKCGSCEEWHHGPILDLSFDQPDHWPETYDHSVRWTLSKSGILEKHSNSFLDSDYCVVEDKSFFFRGLIHLPIIGAAETFCWGVWGSLSRENFELLLKAEQDPASGDFAPMFSWLSNNISEYPDTLSLKMYAHIQEPGMRPHFRLERSDHLLSQEYHHGISPERVKEITLSSLPAQET